MQVGLSEASVLMRKISSFGDPRLYALSLVAEHLSHSSQPLVPERVFVAAGGSDTGGSSGGMLGVLLNLLVAEKSGFHAANGDEPAVLKEVSERITREALEALRQPANGASKN
jgi:hypothetical protein